MTDIWTKEKRSEVMSRIRSRGNRSTELKLLGIMRTYRVTGWRRGQKLPGSPDFVFREHRLAVFVDGCFWHGCVKCYSPPATNQEFWNRKYSSNKKHDRIVNRTLRARGWKVLRIWEHQLKLPGRVVARIQKAMEGEEQQ